MIMHPYRSDLDGKDISTFKDQNGKHLFVEFVRVVQQQGAGFVGYMWQWKDEAERIVPKTSYVKGFQPWGWIIGTGLYVDDIEAEIAAIRHRLSAVSGGILLIMSSHRPYRPSLGIQMAIDELRAGWGSPLSCPERRRLYPSHPGKEARFHPARGRRPQGTRLRFSQPAEGQVFLFENLSREMCTVLPAIK